MKRFFTHGFSAIIFVCVLVSLGGCASSKPPSFYILHSLQAPETGKTGAAQRDFAVGIGPVTIPDYLDRPQIATRTTSSSLQFAEFDRWAEPLEKNLTRVLVENLSALLATDRIVVFPWPKFMQVRYQVSVEITRLDNMPDGRVVLGARWLILDDEGEKLVFMKKSDITVPVSSPGFEAVASAESRAIEALSREIAEALKSLPRETEAA